jgi:hypothetical protein
MSSKTEDLNKAAMVEFLGLDDYKDLWKIVKEDLHARVLSND